MRLADLVAATDAVAATPSRTAKTEVLADLLRKAGPTGAAVVAKLVVGDPRQGRIGVGWATVAGIRTEPVPGPALVPGSGLTVADLDSLLDAIAATSGSGSAARRISLLEDFLTRATTGEAGFLRRLLVGELRQGAGEGVVTEALARAGSVPPAALRRALMLSGDLGAVAEIALSEGSAGLEAVGLEVLRPIRPMLATTAVSVAEAVSELGRASVEWKLDGIRIQAHRRDGIVKIWTRNLNEVTDRLGEVVEIVRSFPVRAAVLDGEVVGPTPMFFDLVHRDGRDLLDEPLVERLDHLTEVAPAHRVPGVVTDDPVAAAAVFAEAIDRGHEGVVVKAADAAYQAGRRGKSWRKVKPVHTLDLVVLAAEAGSGRRRGTLSNIHLGALAPDGSFVMVGKTFKGMTDEMLEWQTRRFGALATSERGYVTYLRPEQVVEIALDGVQQSSRYPGGVALRFARVVRYRTDKPASGADTIEAVRKLL